MFGLLERLLQTDAAGRADVVQLRGQRRVVTTCTVKNGAVADYSSLHLIGISARAFVDRRSWGFSSTNQLNVESATAAVQNALTLARASSHLKTQARPLPPLNPVAADVTTPITRSPRDLTAEDTAQIPVEAARGAKEAGARVKDAKVTYIALDDDKYFLSSDGSRIHQNTARVMLFIDVIAKRGRMLCPASESLGHSGGLELFDQTSPHALGKRVADQAVKLLQAKAPPSGEFPVVVHPTLCATLLHEAIGHPLEADLAMAGGGFGNRLGEPVSSNLITIYDHGQVRGGLGYFGYDDEGVACKRTNLIDRGVLTSFMHDRTSAAAAGVEPTGNAHAWDYSVEPLIRQTNIGIEAGDYALDEMLEDVDEGLFLQGTFGGQADVNADFTFGFQKAHWIRHGRLAEELRGANVAGNAIHVFQTVDAVGKQAVLRPGACGKFQFAVQGRVVPAVRCKMMVGGTGGR